jgi:hypothetical protein
VHRYYDPATGQFLSVDPLVDATGQPYAYTGDDPVNCTDKIGLGPIVNPDAPLGLLPSDFLPPGNEGWITYQPSASTLQAASRVEAQAQTEAFAYQNQERQQLLLIRLRSPDQPLNSLEFGIAPIQGPSAAQLYVACELDVFWSQQATAAYDSWAATEGIPYDDSLAKRGIVAGLDEAALEILRALIE